MCLCLRLRVCLGIVFVYVRASFFVSVCIRACVRAPGNMYVCVSLCGCVYGYVCV